MDLRYEKVTLENPNRLLQLRRLYEASFPVEERCSWESICRKLADDEREYSMSAVIMPSGCFAGFISMWRFPECVYVEHFAIGEELRGSGIGGHVMDEVVRSAGNLPVVLEAEMPETGEMARRRIGFYRRHGFVACEDFAYVQPSYETGLPLMPLMLMVSGQVASVENIALRIHRRVYGAEW